MMNVNMIMMMSKIITMSFNIREMLFNLSE